MNRIEVAKLSKLPEKLGMSLKVGEHDIALSSFPTEKSKRWKIAVRIKGEYLLREW